MNAHTLTGQEASRAYEAKYGSENRYSLALAVVRALPLATRIRLLTEVTQHEDFADFDVRDTAALDKALDHMLTAAEADRSVNGWAL